MWAGIRGGTIIGPLFVKSNLNYHSYLNLLQEYVQPLITETVEKQVDEQGILFHDEDVIHIQYDGALPCCCKVGVNILCYCLLQRHSALINV